MECEVCGSQIYRKAHKVIIDGAKLLVCFDCSQFTPTQQKPKIEGTTIQPTQKLPTRSRTPRLGIGSRERSVRQPIISEDSVLVEDYGKRIRQGRELFNLNHEELSRKIGVKISLLQKLETGKMVPDHNLIKKLESTLKIKLLRHSTSIQVDEQMLTNKPSNLTLGDVVVQKRRRGAAER